MVKQKICCVPNNNYHMQCRCVTPFSNASRQKCTRVIPPPCIPVFSVKNVNGSAFRKFFLRGDIPIQRCYVKGTPSHKFIQWLVPPECLDYCYYLPLFFEGLCEVKFPFSEFARNGVHDMLSVGGNKILPCVPSIVLPIKKALNTKNSYVIMNVLRAIQHLLQCDPCIGRALVPYYRQILPMLNLFRNKKLNIGDRVDQKRCGHVGDLINETLLMMERYGGQDAYINIKYMVPTYESFVHN